MPPEPPDDASSAHRRATWVGLRTLRQRPRPVGQTPAGDPIVEVRSVRLVLRNEASHFNRLVPCSKCGAEVPGSAVVSLADLDQPAYPVICTDCVRTATAGTGFLDRRPPAVPAAVEDAPSAVEPQVEPAPAPAGVAPAGGEVDAALVEVRAELAAASEAAAARAGVLAEDLRRLAGGLQDELRQMRAELDEDLRRTSEALAAVTGELPALRSAIERVAEEARAVSQAQAALDVELADLGRRVDGVASSGEELRAQLDGVAKEAAEGAARLDVVVNAADAEASRLHTLEQNVQSAVRRMTRMVGAQGRHRPAPAPSPPEGPATLPPGRLLDDLERQLQEAEGRLARRTAGGPEPA